MRKFYAFVFDLLGWKIAGEKPAYHIKKYIIIVAPHTSNWDFLVGVGARAKLDFYPRYVAKKELFIGPLSWLFKRLGGYPVDRSSKKNLVDQMVDLFNKEDEFILTITPEGTRKHNPKWKTGFFFIAQKADVPIVPVAFDYANKQVVIGNLLKAEGDIDLFVKNIKNWYSQFTGKHPEQGISKEES